MINEMHTSNSHFAFMNRNADLNAYTPEALLYAAAHRENWFDDLEQRVMKLSKAYVAKELDYGYRAIRAVIAQQRIPSGARHRMHGALLSWLDDELKDSYIHLINMDDLSFTRYAQENSETVLRIEGGYRALNLFKDKKQTPALLPSVRISALQRLQEVRLVHFSHQWQGPYKAALVHGVDKVMCIDLDLKDPLYRVTSTRYKASEYNNYMTKAKALEFRKAITTGVPRESFKLMHHLLLELLPNSEMAQ